MIATTDLLKGIPLTLRDDLIERYKEIARNYLEHRWEPAELNGGKFAEVAYSVAHGAVSGTFPTSAAKPPDFAKSCRSLESIPPDPARVGDRSLRVLIPRVLVALYEIRNNRGVGHIGGEVNPNAVDSSIVFGMSSWVLAEFVRIFHGCTTEEAQEAVNTLAERPLPLVWVVPGTDMKRILKPTMTAKNQVLVLLHVKQGWMSADDLFEAVEYRNLSNFRTKVLAPLHKERLIEYDTKASRAHITPTGAKEAEDLIK